jgi:PhnB protein
MTPIKPYLSFDNNSCKEAMNFYKDCLGGELTLMTVRESPAASQLPPQYQDSILHSSLVSGQLEIMGSDLSPEPLNTGNDVYLTLNFKDEEETRKLFDKLSADGKVVNPIKPMFFGLMGALKDKFGKRWMLVCDLPGSN